MSNAFEWMIPDYFYIMAQKIKVKFEQNLISEEGRIGKTSNSRGLIKLQENNEQTETTQDNVEIAFFHEYYHNVFQVIGIDQRYVDDEELERDIDLMARMHHQLLESGRIIDSENDNDQNYDNIGQAI